LLFFVNTSVFKGNEKDLFINLFTKLQELIKTAIFKTRRNAVISVVRADIAAKKIYLDMPYVCFRYIFSRKMNFKK